MAQSSIGPTFGQWILIGALASFVFGSSSDVSGDRPADDSSETAEQILRETGITGGMIVHLHCGDAPLTAQLFMAGPPDIVPDDDPYASLEGRWGARLWGVSAEDGTKLAEYRLDAVPAFDGLIAAGGQLYMITEGGQLSCWKPK